MKLESELSKVKAEIVDTRIEVALSRAKADLDMAIYLEDATNTQAKINNGLKS